MIYLKQSTASQEIPLGYFLDSTDGDTAETGLTIANTDIKLWKAGATTLADKNSGGGTHISGGIYYATLDATDTNTLGPMVIFVHVSGALPVRLECCVLAANIYDSMIAGSDLLDVNTSQIEGSDATDQINAACDTALSDYDAPTKAELDASFPTNFADLAITSGDGYVSVGTNTDKTGYTLTQTFPTNFADLAITATTGRVTVGTNSDKTGYSISGTKTTLDALTDIDATGVENAVWDATMASHVTGGSTGAALNAAGAAGDPWSTSIPGAYGAGTAGYIIGNNLNAPVGTVDTVVDAIKAVTDNLPNSGALTDLATASALATVDTNVDAILGDTSELQTAGLAAAIAALPTAAENRAEMDSNSTKLADILADTEDMQPKLGAPAGGSMSADIAAIKSDTGNILTDTAEIGTAGAGLTALASAANLATLTAYVDTEVAAILADTGEIQGDWANGGRLDLILDAIKAVTDNLPNSGALTDLATAASLSTVSDNVDEILTDTGTTLQDAINGLNDISAADILSTALTESYSADGAAPTLTQAIYLIMQFLYERVTSGTTVAIKRLDGTTTAATALLDDSSTPTSITRNG